MFHSAQSAFTRRVFMQRSLGLISTATTLPLFLQNAAFALDDPMGTPDGAPRPGVPEDRILVVVQLGGGNDGLNTVVPFGEQRYYDARPNIAIPEREVLKFRDHRNRHAAGIGLHPAMEPMMDLYNDGRVAMLQGVGYPNPNRSHFKSMDIWHTANVEGEGRGHGWIGRYFDNACKGQPDPEPNLCVSIGPSAPPAMQGERIQPVAFEDPRLFRWTGASLHPDLAKAYDRINRAGVVGPVGEETPASFLMRTALDAQLSSDRIRDAMKRTPEVAYPRTGLANSMKMIASMIQAGLRTRVYYADLGGFDTHAGQPWRHAARLREFAGAVKAFYDDLKKQGNQKRVLIMTFSEFGRRVKQNASGGTDHGTAAPMFLIGDMLKPGIYGPHPSLAQLDPHGDLVHRIDFRSVYTTILQQWMRADAEAILGGRFPPAPILARG